MQNILARKLILLELLHLNSKHKNNIKRKRLWVWQILWKDTQGEFHILVKELKLFYHEFFFKHIDAQHFDCSQQCLTVFLFNCCIQQFHWYHQIIYSTSEFFFFNSKMEKKNLLQGKEITVFLENAFFCVFRF